MKRAYAFKCVHNVWYARVCFGTQLFRIFGRYENAIQTKLQKLHSHRKTQSKYMWTNISKQRNNTNNNNNNINDKQKPLSMYFIVRLFQYHWAIEIFMWQRFNSPLCWSMCSCVCVCVQMLRKCENSNYKFPFENEYPKSIPLNMKTHFTL